MQLTAARAAAQSAADKTGSPQFVFYNVYRDLYHAVPAYEVPSDSPYIREVVTPTTKPERRTARKFKQAHQARRSAYAGAGSGSGSGKDARRNVYA